MYESDFVRSYIFIRAIRAIRGFFLFWVGTLHTSTVTIPPSSTPTSKDSTTVVS